MKNKLPDFTLARVLVVGDVMLDQYWHGSSQRISPEAPVPVVHIKQNECRAGGASNVALNIAALGATVQLIGLTGDDDNADKLQSLLIKQQVECSFLRNKDLETTLKLRVISQHQQMIRLDFEDSFASVDKTPLNSQFATLLSTTDVVILSDYHKGTLSHVGTLIQMAKQANIPIIIDPKGTDFVKYQGASLITPNRSEFEAVVGKCHNEQALVSKGLVLLKRFDWQALLVTRGEEGMSLFQRDKAPIHLPTYAREVFDVTGAGDTVIGTLAAALAAKADLASAVRLANLAAGLVVRKLGTATTSIAEIQDALHSHAEIELGIITEDQLEEVIKLSQQRGEKVIMTNGCFDLMHTGHITYLQQARELGDRLVIAVNADESVKQLKGDSRPINTLQNRMTMLAALECVDWVVPFTEETPERLYCRILPDMVVKGGDYAPNEVAGGQCVLENGGEVKILSFVDGQSTSTIIEKIKLKATL
ncbi:MAG TPA: bifunctional D-glycero-beta-D-manno-heptose-7-phosphate kinase/D-glycero-beta-D-manno-heptose 1-phosphate adenylyltransferase HldE [Leucothrix mucor]|uniref:Bifunctional protein HldE n=1 Tax=Leucothrix mucor TaxID=45248 RepID=A0A7V2WV73_LEUMU|nr:bifunctional D-glycero-beta-D-manno-heptose-7-phosphate kinase/D-glycero-beta-D-manno-heptose 1-phosphate adenylyltransferase HldE [Leucothrix mucor]